MRIENKAQMYDLLQRGLLGNRFRIWDTEEKYRHAVAEGFDRLVGVRCVGVPGLPYFHHKTFDEAIRIGADLKKKYGSPVRYYEGSPDQYITIQGEIKDYPHGYGLEYSTKRTHMRAALAQERISEFSSHMPSALRRVLDDQSLEDFYWLFDQYPGCVVEFTAYEVPVGVLPGRLHVVWEARHY